MYIAFEPYSNLHKSAADKDLKKPPFDFGFLKNRALPLVDVNPNSPEWGKSKKIC